MSKKPIQMELPLSKTRTANLRAGSLRVREAVQESVKEALKNCSYDREFVAQEISRLTGEHCSIHALNNMCAEGKQNRRFPLEFAKALALITGDIGILRAALGPQFFVLDEAGAAAHDYGLLILENKVRVKRKKQLEEAASSLIPGGVN